MGTKNNAWRMNTGSRIYHDKFIETTTTRESDPTDQRTTSCIRIQATVQPNEVFKFPEPGRD